MITPTMRLELVQLAATFPSQELCGLITTDGEVVQVTNVSKRPCSNFAMDPKEFYATVEHIEQTSGVYAVWHSHVKETSEPSDADMEYFQRSPWHMVIVGSDGVREIKHA